MENLEFIQILHDSKKYFQYRDRTSEEVRSFLISKGYSQEKVEEFITEATVKTLISDSRVIENSVDISLHSKKRGPLRIFNELLARGIPENQLVEKMEELPEDVLRENCKALIYKKIRTKSPSKKDIFNCFQMLIQKGYEEEMIISVLREEKISLPTEEE
jgi:SOS response regulatory protein OraA/RecX